MKTNYPIPFHYKVIFFVLVLIGVGITALGYTAKEMAQNTLFEEKRARLISMAKVLDTQLGEGGYEAILASANALQAPREEKISILNSRLSPITDAVASTMKGLGIGYYNRELDCIITYGPSSTLHHTVGQPIAANHPGREAMATNTILVRYGKMVRGNILNAMVPIVRSGKVIGYIWANELTTEIEQMFHRITRYFTVCVLVCCAISALVLILVARRGIGNIRKIVSGLEAMRHDLTARIDVTGGELGLVAANINALANDVNKATIEAERAMTVMRSVLGNIDVGVYASDPETDEIVYANDSVLAACGCGDISGMKCYEVLEGRQEPCPHCPKNKLYNKNGQPKASPLQIEIHNEQCGRDFLTIHRLATWPDGRLMHVVTGADLTDRNALMAAEAANKAQRDFLARMSHEIRTPMNGVLGMTRLALQANPSPEQSVYLNKIEASATLLLGIINDILDFSKIEAGKMTIESASFNLHEAINNVRELVKPRILADVDFLVSVDERCPHFVIGDRLRLSQVLLNLLGNAAKFTQRGQVALEVKSSQQEDGKIRLDCAVQDSGIGMDSVQQEALFLPFSQADESITRKFGGTGLGLSICKSLVELMGGAITVSSEPGKGSVFAFYVILGLDSGENATAIEANEPWRSASYDGCHFLLVEDNAINQEIAVAVLEELGAEIDVAENGHEGLAAFLEHDYDAIFMDMRMPVMDGLEATRRIRASDKHDAGTVPIIAMTANAMEEDRESSRKAGMNGHVAKPLDMRELKQTLYACVAPRKV